MEIKVITICGSMRYSKEMMKIAEELELKKGYAVIRGKISRKYFEERFYGMTEAV